jgi:glycosyltransferase involved in cell wall biosynthesis
MQADTMVSVVICVHNGEKYLAQTLESVARQNGVSYEGNSNGIEVIIIDDQSTDSSAGIIKRYVPIFENKGFSVRCIFHSENKSIPKSYTEGALLARGKYFKILDHDDILASDRALVEPVEFMESMQARGYSVGAVFSKTLYMDEEGTIFGEKRFPFPFLPYEAPNGLIPRKWGQFVIIFSPLYPFVHGSSVVRKACWQELSVQHMSQYGTGLFDVLFTLHVMQSRNWRVGYFRAPSLQYRIHPSSFTQSSVKRGTWIEILDEQYERIYGNRLLLAIIKAWTRCVQSMKSLYHGIKGANAFKSIGIFGRHK